MSWPIKIFTFVLSWLNVNNLNQSREQGMGIEIQSLIHLCINLTNTLQSPPYVPGTTLRNTVWNKAETILMVWNLYSNGGVRTLTNKISNCNKNKLEQGHRGRRSEELF